MPVTCGVTCTLWNPTGTRCRVTNAVRNSGTTCALTSTQKLSLLKQSRLIAGDSSGGSKVTIVAVTPCPAGGHVVITYNVDDGPNRQRVIDVYALRHDIGRSAEERVISAMRDLCVLCGVTTGNAIKTAIEGSSFWLPGGD